MQSGKALPRPLPPCRPGPPPPYRRERTSQGPPRVRRSHRLSPCRPRFPGLWEVPQGWPATLPTLLVNRRYTLYRTWQYRSHGLYSSSRQAWQTTACHRRTKVYSLGLPLLRGHKRGYLQMRHCPPPPLLRQGRIWELRTWRIWPCRVHWGSTTLLPPHLRALQLPVSQLPPILQRSSFLPI